MHPTSMDLLGSALLDFFHGDPSTKVVIHREDGEKSDLSVNDFFRDPPNFFPTEQIALDLCRGRILDVGAGAGPHSLALQDQGFAVWAVDISLEACEVMRKRGVKHVYCADILDFKVEPEVEPFDTLLILGRTIGMVEHLAGLDRFLCYAHSLLNPDGQILLTSSDVRCTTNPNHLAYQEANRQAGRYHGEFRLQLEYKGQSGTFFGWLYVDPEVLADRALKAGWECQVIHREEDGSYLARLVSSDSTPRI